MGLKIWFISGCFLVLSMVLVGGITRLTHSGLSISDYKITRILPPQTEEEWQDAFDLYKQYPEYQKLNYNFNLQDFKSIYFWEWLHRFLGRLIGIVFIIPYLYFFISGSIKGKLLRRCTLILFLGGFQGFLGWFMVKSGLIENPDVSHYRLALHLFFALITYSLVFWCLLDQFYKVPFKASLLTKYLFFGIILLSIQIIWGGFVAGLDAGFIHNSWPLMSDQMLIHPTVFSEKTPFWLNFIDGKSGVQFIHRILAYILFIYAFVVYYKSRKIGGRREAKQGVYLILIMTSVQLLLGILTLVWRVPITMGVLHQIGAFFLMTSYIYALYHSTRI